MTGFSRGFVRVLFGSCSGLVLLRLHCGSEEFLRNRLLPNQRRIESALKYWRNGHKKKPRSAADLLFSYFLANGGSNLLLTSPNPIRISLFLHQPFMITVSLSLINLRSVPSFILIGFLPFQVSSSIEPKLSGVGPEIVPDPIMSPELTRQPFEVWCASC